MVSTENVYNTARNGDTHFHSPRPFGRRTFGAVRSPASGMHSAANHRARLLRHSVRKVMAEKRTQRTVFSWRFR